MTDLQTEDGFAGLPQLVSLIWPLDQADADLARRLNERVLGRIGSLWGRGQSFYRQPPFLPEAGAAAGWQDPRSPGEVIRAFLGTLDGKARDVAAQAFSDLDADVARTVLLAVIGDENTPRDAVAATAFPLLRELVYDALFVGTIEDEPLGWQWFDRDSVEAAERPR